MSDDDDAPESPEQEVPPPIYPRAGDNISVDDLLDIADSSYLEYLKQYNKAAKSLYELHMDGGRIDMDKLTITKSVVMTCYKAKHSGLRSQVMDLLTKKIRQRVNGNKITTDITPRDLVDSTDYLSGKDMQQNKSRIKTHAMYLWSGIYQDEADLRATLKRFKNMNQIKNEMDGKNGAATPEEKAAAKANAEASKAKATDRTEALKRLKPLGTGEVEVDNPYIPRPDQIRVALVTGGESSRSFKLVDIVVGFGKEAEDDVAKILEQLIQYAFTQRARQQGGEKDASATDESL